MFRPSALLSTRRGPFRRLSGSTFHAVLARFPLAAALLLAGCGDEELAPVGPEGPDLTTVQGAITALEEYYSFQKANGAIALLGDAYVFVPAIPESVSFLPPSATNWSLDVEKDILDLMLVPERLSWLDQVLLEVTVQNIDTTPAGLKIVDARVELGLLLGASSWQKGVSQIRLTYAVDANGNHLLIREEETLPDDYNPDLSILVSQQKALVLPDDYTP